MSMNETILSSEIVGKLNELLSIDPEAVDKMISTRVDCKEETAGMVPSMDGKISLFGVINSLLKKRKIVAVYKLNNNLERYLDGFRLQEETDADVR